MCNFFLHSNEKYENFVNAHLKAAAEFIPTKQRTKYRVPWEILAVGEKCAYVKTAFRKNPTNTNALKHKKTQNELANIYLKEQTTYKIRSRLETRLKIDNLG